MNQSQKFPEEKNGYSKPQVNAFIEKITREYKRLYQEHKSLEEKMRQLEQSLAQMAHEKRAASGLAMHFRIKISQLERENARLNARPSGQAPEFTQEVARVLMDAELLAQQIVERAKQGATVVTQEMHVERDRIAAAKDRLIDEARNVWETLRTGAH